MGRGGPKTGIRIAVLCFCLMAAVEGVEAQSASVTMPSRTTTVGRAFAEIKRQTALQPVINYDYIAPGREVSLSSESLPIEQFVKEVLAGTGFAGEVLGKHLLIVPEPPKIDQGEGAIGAMWRDDEVDETVEMETITFRIGNSAPQRDFMNNGSIFRTLDNRLRDTAVLAKLDHISVTAASSPDGNTDANERLAMARAVNTKGYLVRRYPHIAPEKVQAFSVGEEWSGLRKLVTEDERIPDREKVLTILETVSDEDMRDTLRSLSGGRTWRYIAANLMPRLRGATAVTLHFWHNGSERRIDTMQVANFATSGGVQRVEIAKAKPAPIPVEPPPVVIPEPEPRDLFALKTNLISLVSGISIEAEVPIGLKWSLAAEGIIPMWGERWGGGSLEVRRWLGDRTARPVMTGWFAGAHVTGIDDRKGGMFMGGVTGGYAHTIARGGALRMEYSLGVGGLWMEDRVRFRPTRAKISLVWMLRGKQRTTTTND